MQIFVSSFRHTDLDIERRTRS